MLGNDITIQNDSNREHKNQFTMDDEGGLSLSIVDTYDMSIYLGVIGMGEWVGLADEDMVQHTSCIYIHQLEISWRGYLSNNTVPSQHASKNLIDNRSFDKLIDRGGGLCEIVWA